MKRNKKDHGFTALKIEGALFSPEFLQQIASLQVKKQTEADYGISKSLKIKDEIGRYWRIAQDLWTDYSARKLQKNVDQNELGVQQWLIRLLESVLGYAPLEKVAGQHIGERYFPISHFAGNKTIPLVLTTSPFSLDSSEKEFGEEGKRRSPHGLIQEFLNANKDCLWGLVSNGLKMRIVRDNPSLTRPAYIEADLEQIFEEQLYADFATLWLLFHSSRIFVKATEKPDACILEVWRKESHKTGERALAELRNGVTQALRELGNGFFKHPANKKLRELLQSGEMINTDFFKEILILVYRFLFLLTTEERGLLLDSNSPKEAQDIYKEGYSINRLREYSLKRRHYDHYSDCWQSILIIFRGLSEGAKPLALPALGGLFNKKHCPHLETAEINNHHLLSAIHSLSFFEADKVLARVNYRDMGTEELGSVYESLLELHPDIDVESTPWKFAFTEDRGNGKTKGSERKSSGSYYTPPELVNELIKSALEPVIQRTIKENPEEPRKALLNLKICDPACGSGHFLLAATRRLAIEIARIDSGNETPEESIRQHALREVVTHCIYGVDINSMAVELCKTALWIESVEPGKPLGFLDYRIQCGNSLFGATPALMEKGIPDGAFDAIGDDDKKACAHYKKRNKEGAKGQLGLLFEESLPQENLLKSDFLTLEEDSIVAVQKKEKQHLEMLQSQAYQHRLMIANAWCATFVWKKQFHGPEPITKDIWIHIKKDALKCPVELKKEIEKFAHQYQFFHWYLAFPDVFKIPVENQKTDNEQTGWSGGFDVILGNPPWERIKLQEEEFFATRSSEIANAENKSNRGQLIKRLMQENKTLWDEFQDEKYKAEAQSKFLRKSELFSLTGRGDINTYAIFAELVTLLIHRKGKAGIIVPTGIATDDTCKYFFSHLVENQMLSSLYDFENREKLFSDVDSRMKFCLLTIRASCSLAHSWERAGVRDNYLVDFAFFATRTEHLAEDYRHFLLSDADFRLINPNTRTCPIFRSKRDAEITKKVYRKIPVLINETTHENPWNLSFMRMLDMANDSDLFHTRDQLESQGFQLRGNRFVGPHPSLLPQAGEGEEDQRVYLPLYEAKMIHHFDHRWATYGGLETRDVALEEKQDPEFSVLPRYWIAQEEVEKRIKEKWEKPYLLGWRDICRNTDERTVIASIIPRVSVGDTFLLMFPNKKNSDLIIANLNSFILDYISRQKIGGTHLKYHYFKQLPMLLPSQYEEKCSWANELLKNWICEQVLPLVYTNYEMKEFAQDCGYDGPPFKWDEERRFLLRCELDAAYFHLYQIERDDVDYILETFPIVKKKDEARYQEYRTKRVILEIYDKLAEAIKSGKPYQSRLNPPLADPSCQHPKRE